MKPLAVLVADDVEELRNLLRHWLSEMGHSVTCAANGLEATHHLRRQRYDLIITDVVMPESDGLEVIGEARKTSPESRILAISGGGKFLKEDMCLKLSGSFGAHVLLRKPFNREQFFASVDRALTAA
jgi:two-component system cell cycle response regulator CpdR